MTLIEQLQRSEKLFKETGHYSGIKRLSLKEKDHIRFEQFHSKLLSASVSARESVVFIAASPAVRDFQELVFALYTPEGDAVALSPGIMVHVHTMSEFVKYMIQNDYEHDPGIKEGDIFENNETWAGGVHTADIQTAMPIFYEGELVGWTGGVTHELDVGGYEPGSMPLFCADRFVEGFHISAERVGENYNHYKFFLKRIETNVRNGGYFILDEKVRLAGCMFIIQEVEKIIKEFGLDYYKKATRELIEENRRIFLSNVKRRLIPGRYQTDGAGTGAFYEGIKTPQPQNRINASLHVPLEVTVKADGKILLDFEGTNAWGYHVFNCFPSSMNGGLWVAMTQFLGYDQRINDGFYLCVEQNLPKGSLVNADNTTVSTTATWGTLIPAFCQFLKLMSIGLFARGFLEEVMQGGVNSLIQGGGIDQYGKLTGFSNFETTACGSGGRAVMDGIDCGYSIWNPEADQGNLEVWELIAPILYLGRAYVPNAHGYGKFRGGNSWESLFLIKPTPQYQFSILFPHKTPGVNGLFGGYPSPVVYAFTAHQTNIGELTCTKKSLPSSVSHAQQMLIDGELKASVSTLHDTPLLIEKAEANDLIGICYTGGAGYGDPIRREPQMVIEDIKNGVVTPDMAEEVYGVVVQNGAVETTATEKKRQDIRRRRLERAVPVKDWWKKEREKILKGELAPELKAMLKSSKELSEKYAKRYKEFWQI